MKFRILGPLEVEAGGQLLELGGTRQRMLMAALLLQANHVVSSDRLIEEVWGGRPPEHAASVLHSSVSRLRRILRAGSRGKAVKMLVTRGRGYQLLVEDQQLDSLAFERLVEEGRRALVDDPSRAADVLRNALGLWRGEVLADVRDHFLDRGQIAHLDNLRAVALEARVEADLALGPAS